MRPRLAYVSVSNNGLEEIFPLDSFDWNVDYMDKHDKKTRNKKKVHRKKRRRCKRPGSRK